MDEYIYMAGVRYKLDPEPVKDLVVRIREGMMDGWSADAACISAELAEEAASEIDRLRRVLRNISYADQGAGGNLTYEEMAKSAMSQAREALT
jgi:hypothetical protein